MPRLYKERLEAIRDYIENNLGTSLNISQIAAKFGMGESTLRRTFSKAFGMPLYQFVQESRMGIAKQFLQQGTMTIAEISEALGYQNYSAFTKAFTKFYGIPPIQFCR